MLLPLAGSEAKLKQAWKVKPHSCPYRRRRCSSYWRFGHRSGTLADILSVPLSTAAAAAAAAATRATLSGI